MSMKRQDPNFKIISIKTQRSMNGSSTIKAEVFDDYYDGEDITISIKINNQYLSDKTKIKDELVSKFWKSYMMPNKKETTLKIGDII